MEKVEVNADLMVQNLLNQISRISKENATNYALAVQYKAELDKQNEGNTKKESKK